MTSRPSAVVVDANSLLSALIGGQAMRIFRDGGTIRFLVADFTLVEVKAYLPRLARKAGIEVNALATALDLLGLERVPRERYESMIPHEESRIGGRDPKDVDVLALALALDAPLWTNDRDFDCCGVETITTAMFLKRWFDDATRG